MSLLACGSNTSAVEVTNISKHGLWLLTHNKELFISYHDFPWFAKQPINLITHVEEQALGHYYWPDLDIDLTDEIIEHPERFPLKVQL